MQLLREMSFDYLPWLMLPTLNLESKPLPIYLSLLALSSAEGSFIIAYKTDIGSFRKKTIERVIRSGESNINTTNIELKDAKSVASADKPIKAHPPKINIKDVDFLYVLFDFLSKTNLLLFKSSLLQKKKAVTRFCKGIIMKKYPGHGVIKGVKDSTTATIMAVDFKTAFWSLSRFLKKFVINFFIFNLSVNYVAYHKIIEKQLMLGLRYAKRIYFKYGCNNLINQ